MKILHVTQGYFPAIGGTERLVQRVSEELVRQFGDEVTVFTTTAYNGEAFARPWLPRMRPGLETRNGVQVRRFPVQSWISLLLTPLEALATRLRLPYNDWLRTWFQGPIVPELSRAIMRHPADVIAAASFPLLHMFAALEGARRSARPCVLNGGLHPLDSWGYDRRNIYQAIRRADRYVAYTPFEAAYVIGRGASPERVVTIGAGVDLEQYRVDPRQARAKLGLGNEPLIGFIGQLGGHKGLDTLLRAMPLVWSHCPEAHVLIAGARTLFVPIFERMISEFSESQRSRVHTLYNFPEETKPWLFAALDVFAYPSGYESFGIAYLEAAAALKPVIGCRQGAVPDVIRPGWDGFLVPYQDDQRLAWAILTLLRNPALCAQMGEAGFRKVQASYTWATVARAFREVYQEALIQANRQGLRKPAYSRQ